MNGHSIALVDNERRLGSLVADCADRGNGLLMRFIVLFFAVAVVVSRLHV